MCFFKLELSAKAFSQPAKSHLKGFAPKNTGIPMGYSVIKGTGFNNKEQKRYVVGYSLNRRVQPMVIFWIP